MNRYQNFKVGDIVTIDENDIDSSADAALLKKYINKKLLIIGVNEIDSQLVQYICMHNNEVIMYKKDIPFGFIDADLKLYDKRQGA